MKRVVIAVAAAVLVLSACGDDGNALDAGGETELSAEEQTQADRVAASLLAEDDEDDGAFDDITAEQADCVGANVVAELGVERVEAIDWDAEESPLIEEDAPGVASAFVACVDVRPLFTAAFAEGGELTQEQAQCISDDFSDDEIEGILAFSLANPDAAPPSEVAEPLADTIVACLDFGAILVEQFTAADGGGVSEASAQCLADAIPEDLIRSAVLSGITGEDAPEDEAAFERAVVGAADDCLTDEELAGLGG
jgi:hypothetical protein